MADNMYLFWLIDISGSMKGKKLDRLNEAMKTSFQELRRIAEKQRMDENTKVQVVLYSNGAKAVYDTPVRIDQVAWNDISCGGVTDFGAGIKRLTEEISKCDDIDFNSRVMVFLITDGYPTDDYQRSFERFLNLPQLRKAIRLAIALGDDTDEDVLRQFAGDYENVIRAESADQLAEGIQKTFRKSYQILEALGSSRENLEQLSLDRFEEESIKAYVTSMMQMSAVLPATMKEEMENAAEDLVLLQAAVEQYPSNESGVRRFLRYYIPETIRLAYIYQSYDGVDLSREQLDIVYSQVMKSIQQLRDALKQKKQEIYEMAALETVAKADALQRIIAQDGYE